MTATSIPDKITCFQVSKMHKTARLWSLTQLISTKCCVWNDRLYAVCANCVPHVAETSTMAGSHQLPWLLHSLVLLTSTHTNTTLAILLTLTLTSVYWLINWGFMSHPTQNWSFQRRSSQPVSWLSTKKLKTNATKANMIHR